MPSGHWQDDALYRALRSVAGADNDIEAIATGERCYILAANVGLRRKTISDNPAIADIGQNRLNLWMVEAHDCRAIKRHVLDKFDKGPFDGIEITIMVKMLWIDVGDNRQRPIKAQEAAVAFVSLNNHPVTRTQTRV